VAAVYAGGAAWTMRPNIYGPSMTSLMLSEPALAVSGAGVPFVAYGRSGDAGGSAVDVVSWNAGNTKWDLVGTVGTSALSSAALAMRNADSYVAVVDGRQLTVYQFVAGAAVAMIGSGPVSTNAQDAALAIGKSPRRPTKDALCASWREGTATPSLLYLRCFDLP